MLIRNLLMAGAALGALTAVPALAQEAAPSAATAPAASVTPKAGDQVVDPQGGSVGTIESVSGTNAVIDTGTNKAAVPFSSFAKSDKGLLFGMTKAELDAAASSATADAKADFAAKLASGAPVVDKNGAALGTIEANDGSLVTLARGESKVKLPVAAFGPTASGTGVQLGMSAAELDAATKQAGAGDPGAAPETAAETSSASPQSQ